MEYGGNCLYIGTISGYGNSNTCLHRLWALQRLMHTDILDTTGYLSKFQNRVSRYLFTKYNFSVSLFAVDINKEILDRCSGKYYDIVWIDKGLLINSKTLSLLKSKNIVGKIIGYSPDNMMERHNQSQNFLDSFPYYDYYVTTKSYTVDILKRMGCSNIIFVNNAFEESFHYPYNLTDNERNRLGGKVGFIGAWEQERYNSILYLAENGIPIKVWGGGKWLICKNKYPTLEIKPTGLFSDEYNKALSAFDISLCFLRKMNFDLQTTRTMEIPACGSLLMAERTSEHMQLFEENKEAVFFSNNEELLEKCRYYLHHEEERKQITKAARERCLKSGYSNYETLRRVLKIINSKK